MERGRPPTKKLITLDQIMKKVIKQPSHTHTYLYTYSGNNGKRGWEYISKRKRTWGTKGN